MAERGLIGNWLAKSTLRIERMRILMCMGLGFVGVFQYANLYMVLSDYWEFLANIYILSVSTFIVFSFIMWVGGVMLWTHTNPRTWLDDGYRVKLPNDTPTENRLAAYNWCEDNIKWRRWRMLKNGDFLFANSKQAMYFKIKWMNAQRVKLYNF